MVFLQKGLMIPMKPIFREEKIIMSKTKFSVDPWNEHVPNINAH